ncbi:hypothetical protein [Brevibacillus sp. SYSU BS000544]|uniref:hypothetical protein n=1 Tax=Brevibacillus sp. SYSU BS000544 TaxID=3416443 RepID=UPI003CE49630
MTIQLMKYLPDYYQESRQMKAIMEAVQIHMPDVDGEMWKAFFTSLLSKKSIDLWREEFGVDSYEELITRLRSSGTMNLETLLAQGFKIRETYRDMPEDGMVLSESGVMADGMEFMPLTTVIFSTPEMLLIAKGLVKLMGLSGFQYLFSVLLQEKIKVDLGSVASTRSLFTDVTMHDRFGDELSGEDVIRANHHSLFLSEHRDADRKSWWTPNVSFSDDVHFSDETFSIQQCTIKKMT